MVAIETPVVARMGAARWSAAQTRVLDAALALIPDHGVSGTSLQMIADVIGVTKAAVYHQFKTKEEIVLALVERELAGLELAVEAAEAETDRPRALEVLTEQVIEMAVSRRRWTATLQSDPVMVRLLAQHPPFTALMERLYGLLLGDDVGPATLVPAALMSAAIAGGVIHPYVQHLDDETLKAELMSFARRFFPLLG
jgi:AcrR family transcriptional regulator